MIKAIFWDNDGVLVDSERWFYAASKKVLESEGIYLSEEEFIRISLHEGGSTLSLLKNKGYDENDIKPFRKMRNQIYDEMLIENDIAVDNSEEILQELSKNFRMIIVTGSCRDHFDTQHSRTGFTKYFERVFSAGDYERQKPYPDSYLTALKELKLQPHEVIVIEDSPRGVEAAKAAGLKVIAVKQGFAKNFNHSKADYVVDNLKLIPPLIYSMDTK